MPRTFDGDAPLADAPNRLDGQGQRRQYADAGRDGHGKHAPGRMCKSGSQPAECGDCQYGADQTQQQENELAWGHGV